MVPSFTNPSSSCLLFFFSVTSRWVQPAARLLDYSAATRPYTASWSQTTPATFNVLERLARSPYRGTPSVPSQKGMACQLMIWNVHSPYVVTAAAPSGPFTRGASQISRRLSWWTELVARRLVTDGPSRVNFSLTVCENQTTFQSRRLCGGKGLSCGSGPQCGPRSLSHQFSNRALNSSSRY